MARRMFMLLAVTALAALLAGCGGSIREGSSHQGSSSSQEESSTQQPEVTSTSSVGSCADNGSTVRQQEARRGKVSNGKIAFTRTTADATNIDIYTIDEEGNHEIRLTHTTANEAQPAWSPDGEKIAFIRGRSGVGHIYMMDADGTNETRLVNYTVAAGPVWSPVGEKMAILRGGVYVISVEDPTAFPLISTTTDQDVIRTSRGYPVWLGDDKKIAFTSFTITSRPPSSASPDSAGAATAPAAEINGIYVINVDGTGLCVLPDTDELVANSPTETAWLSGSPDGAQIAFYDDNAISVINADGTGRKELTNTAPVQSQDAWLPAWSPNSERIAFVKQAELYVINADNTELRRLANTTAPESFATWSPDGAKIAFSCPAAPGALGTDLCVIKADGTGWKRLALKVVPEGDMFTASWGNG